VLASGVKLSIILTTLLSTFATTAPDLCDDVFLDASGEPVMDLVGQTLSRFCKWSGPDVPVWDANVCCSFANGAAHCIRTDTRGRCSTSTSKRYCEYGELGADGRVTCYQPFPDACETGMCIEAPEIIPEAQMSHFIMCCAGGACQYVVAGHFSDCQGDLLACNYGYLDTDGFVECWD
jgi:hypothetical protein